MEVLLTVVLKSHLMCALLSPAEGWAAQLAQPADLACILLGSLAHCLDNGAALRCFTELRCGKR